MNDAQFVELAAWITDAGLAGHSETATLEGICDRAVALGLPLARVTALIDTLHPIYEGRAFIWKRDKNETAISEYDRSSQNLRRWVGSPFYYLEKNDESLLRRRLTAETEKEFPVFPELRAEGMTDYVAMVNRFAADGIVGNMDCVYSSWTTDAPAGFRDADVADIGRLMPLLALTLKATSLARIAGTLVETYLGRDAGRRVLEGRISRGVAEQIEAAIWFSDLRGYTRLSDTAKPEEIIPLLNEYADAIISAIHEHGGDVLKLMGDGVLAIFTAADRSRACEAALTTAEDAPRRVAGQRAPKRRRTTDNGVVPRPAHRRSVLRQHRQQGEARFHHRRSRGQRGEPHRIDVPLRRSTAACFLRFRDRPWCLKKPSRFSWALCAPRRQPSTGSLYPGERRGRAQMK